MQSICLPQKRFRKNITNIFLASKIILFWFLDRLIEVIDDENDDSDDGLFLPNEEPAKLHRA